MGFSPRFAVVGAFGSAPLPPFGGADASLPAPLGHKGVLTLPLPLEPLGVFFWVTLFAPQSEDAQM